jgi:hypothetical protein
MLTGYQPVAPLSRYRHVVTGLTPSFTDDHLEIQRVALGNAKRFLSPRRFNEAAATKPRKILVT